MTDTTDHPKPLERAAKAEALLLHFTAEAHRRKWDHDRGLDGDGVPIKSEAFDALHRLGEEMRVELEKLRALPAASAAVVPAEDRAALGDRIAAAVQPLLMDTLPKPIAAVRADEVADQVLAVLPAPADRAAVLREAVRRIEDGEPLPDRGLRFRRGADWVLDALRRLVAEAAAPGVGVAADTTPAPHSCGNCDGIDPDTCLTNPNRPATPGPVVPAQPGNDTPVVAYRSHSGSLLRCLTHAPDQTGLDNGAFHPVTAGDLPDGGVCTYRAPGVECGVDVLDPQQPKEA